MAKQTAKQAHVAILLQLFRQFGYEGLSLTKISQETGLGKASLYHHFPGGKADMAAAALTQVNQWLEQDLLPLLAVNQKPIAAFQAMCKEVDRFFDGGRNACLLSVLLCEQSSNELFHEQIHWAFSHWSNAIANVLIQSGVHKTLAKQRGEDAMISIQGALTLSRGLRDYGSFQRVIKQLPQQLCQDMKN